MSFKNCFVLKIMGWGYFLGCNLLFMIFGEDDVLLMFGCDCF